MTPYWSSWSDFLAMGGYGLYVWGSFGVTALVMAAIQYQSTSGRGYAGGVGLILASDFMRALMNVMMMAVKMSYPVKAFETVQQGEVWVERLISTRDSLRPPVPRAGVT